MLSCGMIFIIKYLTIISLDLPVNNCINLQLYRHWLLFGEAQTTCIICTCTCTREAAGMYTVYKHLVSISVLIPHYYNNFHGVNHDA